MKKKLSYACIAILFIANIAILIFEEFRIKTIEKESYNRGYSFGFSKGVTAVEEFYQEQNYSNSNYRSQTYDNSAQQRRAQQDAQWHIQQAKNNQFMSETAGDQQSAEFWQREAQREMNAANDALNGF